MYTSNLSVNAQHSYIYIHIYTWYQIAVLREKNYKSTFVFKVEKRSTVCSESVNTSHSTATIKCPFIHRLKLYALFINGKNKTALIDSDWLYRGAL